MFFKPLGARLLEWKSILVKFCCDYRDQILIGSSILVVTLCIGVVISVIYGGGNKFYIKLDTENEIIIVVDGIPSHMDNSGFTNVSELIQTIRHGWKSSIVTM